MADTLITEGQGASTEATGTTDPTASADATGVTDTSTTSQATSTETSTDANGDDKTGDGTDPAKVEEGAPEKYDFKTPENTTLDNQVLDAVSEVSRELNLSQEKAQKLIDKVAPVMAQRQTEQFNQIQQDWRDTATKDKEYGGDKLTESLVVAKKALDKFGTPELTQFLEQGAGNHPELIRLMVRVGKSISEDSIVSSGAKTPANTDPYAVLYDKTKK